MSIVVITGCSTGIGHALAAAFAAHGDTVVATARNPDTLADLAEAGCDTLALDVTDEVAVEQCLREIGAHHGRIDILVNNAGLATMGPVAEIPAEQVRRQFETNVVAPLTVTQKALPLLRRAGHPMVVNMGSVSGILTTPFAGPYCASKAALHKLSDALRLELAPFGVRVVTVQPGGVSSKLGDNAAAQIDGWLTEDSAYAPLRKAIYGRARAQQKGAMPAADFARELVAALHRPRPRNVIRLGTGSRLLPFLQRWVPIPRRDRMLKRRFGLLDWKPD
ncbi:short chain dehydrogenase [Salinisphaera sp. PC39]|uniref:SDR family oxidoreductase n=1 Tax=Salinisphaera sp. PC39 TaxID=1304156 RepID=UPI00333E79B4